MGSNYPDENTFAIDSFVNYHVKQGKNEIENQAFKHNLLSNLLSSVHDAILAVDENLIVTYYNEMAEKLTGWAASDVIGRSGKEIFDRMFISVSWGDIIQAMRSCSYYENEITASGKDGKLLYVEVHVKRMFDPSGEFMGTVATFRDISRRKAAETGYKESEAQARALADELEKKSKLITDFFINISHEFKTPISILTLGIDLIEKEAGSPKSDNRKILKNTAVMRQNAYRLSRLVSNLLDITKLDAGFMEPSWEMKNVIEWVGSLVCSTELYAKQKGLSIHYRSNAKEKWMFTDGFMLDRILLNLLSNAFKHTLPGGQIDVTCFAEGGSIKITVKDNGEGIPLEKRSIIFDRFRQVNTSLTRASEGSGIGLALTKSLVELLGGKITFDSTVGIGTEFTVELPEPALVKPSPVIKQNSMKLEKRIEMELSDII